MENEMIPLHNGKLNCQRPRITATFFASTFFTSSHALELRDDLGSGESDYARSVGRRAQMNNPSFLCDQISISLE